VHYPFKTWALLAFAVVDMRIVEIAQTYGVSRVRVCDALAQYTGVSRLVADHSEDFLRERCVELLRESTLHELGTEDLKVLLAPSSRGMNRHLRQLARSLDVDVRRPGRR
jgi:hypothetical protein